MSIQRRITIALTAIAITLTACQPGRDAKEQQPLSAIEQATMTTSAMDFALDWANASGEERWDDLKSHYASDEDFSWIEQGALRYTSATEISGGIDQAVAQGAKVTTELENIKITLLHDDTALVIADIEIVFDFGAPEPFGMTGAFSGIAKQADDKWQWLHGHMSEQTR